MGRFARFLVGQMDGILTDKNAKIAPSVIVLAEIKNRAHRSSVRWSHVFPRERRIAPPQNRFVMCLLTLSVFIHQFQRHQRLYLGSSLRLLVVGAAGSI